MRFWHITRRSTDVAPQRVVHRRLRSALLAAAVAALGGSALAQPGTTGDSADAELDVQRSPAQDVAGQREQIREIVEGAAGLSRQIQGMLGQARQENDIILITCLNDKLTQVNANLRTARNRSASYDEAVNTNNRDRQESEFTVMTVLGQNFQTLAQEAAQCSGQDAFDTGATTVTTEVSEDTPVEDANEVPPVKTAPIPFIPPPASPSI